MTPADNEALDRQACEEVLDRFEQAWRSGLPPPLENFLPATPGERPGLLADLVHLDLEFRLKAGQPARVEDYLERFPELRGALGLTRLLAAEFRFRCRQGSPPALEEFRQRFPQHADRLAETLNDTLPQAAANHSAIASPSQPAIPGYEILQELGRGGMGVVYLARQVNLNRLVAVKMILAGSHASPEDVARFLAEAEAVAAFRHPNIVQVHEIGRHQDLPFMVLEYVPGGSLADRLANGPLDPREAAQLLEQLARGMNAAHQAGIVHRDLKPGNILLAWSAERGAKSDEKPAHLDLPSALPKVTDFGLAKRVASGSGLTQTGAVLGTPAYMAPEQAGGQAKRVGPAADVYALGAILYECLTGRPPFQGSNPLETLFQVLHEEPVRPSVRMARLPRDLETVCLKCLQKEPRQRYASAEALAEDLRCFLAGEPISARPVGRAERMVRWARRNPWVALSLVGSFLVLLAATAVSLAFALDAVAAKNLADTKAWEADEQRDKAKQSAVEAHARAKEARDEHDKAKTSAAEARAQATRTHREIDKLYVSRGVEYADQGELSNALLWFTRPLPAGDLGPPLNEELHLQRLSNYWRWSAKPALVQCLFHDEAVATAAFSPDGQRILTLGLRYDPKRSPLVGWKSAHAWDAATGQRLAAPLQSPNASWLAFSADGRRVLIATADEAAKKFAVQVWDPATGRRLSPSLAHKQMVEYAVFSPDGQRVLTLCGDEVRLWDAATGYAPAPPVLCLPRLRAIAFSPDGRRLATACDDSAQVWDAATGVPVTGLLAQAAGTAIAFSPNGKRVVTTSHHGKAHVWDADSGRLLTQLLSHRGPLTYAEFSPDGRRVVTASLDRTARVWDAVTGQPVTPPLEHKGSVTHARFSPDGRLVVTASDDGTARVWSAVAHQAGPVRVWTGRSGRPLTPPLLHQGAVKDAAFSPDGRRLVTAGVDGVVRLWDLGGAAERMAPLRSPSFVQRAFFSPNGQRLLTFSDKGVLRVWNTATGAPLTDFPDYQGDFWHASFSPDSRRLVTTGHVGVRLWDADTGRPLSPRLRDQNGDLGSYAAFSPDGQRVVAVGWGGGRVWDVRTHRPLTPLLRPNRDGFSTANFSPDGQRLVTAGQDGKARIWDVTSGRELVPPLTHQHMVVAASFSPNGRLVLTASWDRTVQLWDATTGHPLTQPLEHQAAMRAASFSPNGRHVLTASEDKTARVWSTATGKALTPPLQHQDVVEQASFSRDGRRVLTVSRDGAVRVWVTATGLPLAPQFPSANGAHAATFTPDGRQVIAAGRLGGLQKWDIGADERPTRDWIKLARFLTGVRLDRLGGSRPLARDEMQACWEALRTKYPQDFTVTPEDALAWHRRQAADCWREGNGPAYLFHAWRSDWRWHVLMGSPLLVR